MPKGVYKRTEEMKMKLRVKKFPNRKRPILSEEHKAKIRLLNEKTRFKNGHKHSLETLRKLSNSLKGRVSPRKGVKLTEETKNKIKQSKLISVKNKGENHYNWKGGISKNVHSITEPKYKKWRMEVFTRDNWICQFCGIRGSYLEAHHIKSWSKYPELRYELNNGVALCRECHKLTDNYKGKQNKKNV